MFLLPWLFVIYGEMHCESNSLGNENVYIVILIVN